MEFKTYPFRYGAMACLLRYGWRSWVATTALNGGDVKHGIYLHKLMFEAIMQNKILSADYVQQNLTNTTICELELLHS